MLTIITPAKNGRLTTLAMVRADLNLSDGADDVFITGLIDQASAAVATWCRRTFALETVRETLHPATAWPCLTVSRFPVASVVSVTIEGRSLTASEYEADRDSGRLYRLDASGSRLHWPAGRAVIEYRAGYVLPGDPARDLPADIERATIDLVRASYFARDRDPLVKSESVDGAVSTSFWIGGFGEGSTLPPNVEGLLSPHRSISFG